METQQAPAAPTWTDAKAWLGKLAVRLKQEGVYSEETFSKIQADFDKAEADGRPAPDLDDEVLEDSVVAERFGRRIDELVPKFNYDKILIEWLKTVPFYQEVSRWIRKRECEMLPNGMANPTAAMCYNLATEDVEMLYNKRYFTSLWLDLNEDTKVITNREQEGTKEVEGVSCHELDHLVLRHVTDRAREPRHAANIAFDAAINSMKIDMGMKLPKGGIIPGQKWTVPKRRKMTPEEHAMHQGLADLIASWPKLQASDWYFDELMKWSAANNYKWGKRGIQMPGGEGEWEIDLTDLHDLWDEIPEEERPFVEAKIREIVKKGVQRAENEQNGWGNMPAWYKDLIKASINDDIDWERALKGWTGSIQRGGRATSIKKINKRYPYQFPGTKRNRVANILVAIDQSGSVFDKMLEWIFGTLGSLAKKVTFTIVHFDCTVDESSVRVWKKGTFPKAERTRAGGTDFSLVTKWANSPENRGKYDGLLIATDGGAGMPGPSRIKRGWLLAPGTKLAFGAAPKGELVLEVDDPSKTIKPGSVW